MKRKEINGIYIAAGKDYSLKRGKKKKKRSKKRGGVKRARKMLSD